MEMRRHAAASLAPLLLMLVLALGGQADGAGRATAYFAGGCFWCMQPPFDKLTGVISTRAGYMGGKTVNPTYEQVSAGHTGHAEAVEITYDPSQVSYARLLETFWRNVDPLTPNRQFCDRGNQYRSAIFYRNAAELRLALESKQRLERERGWTIVTEIAPASTFYDAEEYHQSYYKKNPLRYKYYRSGCGRDGRLEELWGKESRR
jgi:peptide-methionine (S)-S-oxide reductase